jgi:hypothetical protein
VVVKITMMMMMIIFTQKDSQEAKGTEGKRNSDAACRHFVVHFVRMDGNLLIAMGVIINHFQHTIVIHHYESFVA